MRALFFAFIILSLAAIAESCISDDFNSSPSVRLEFSTDTVDFDTVFTDLGTPTARLKVFNRDKKSINISSIRLQKENSNFSLNVDGVSGERFSDVEIRGGDSIFIFIECYIPENRDKTPFLVDDNLLFTTNGSQQEVRLEAYGRNVTRLRNLHLDSDMTLDASQPYVIFDRLSVGPDATLRILPGAQILFHDNASLLIEGRIEAIGEPGNMINLRGDRLDNVLPDVAYDILSGQWDGIRIAPQSFDNRLEYIDMRSTKNGLSIDSTANTDRTKLTLVNSWLHNSESSVLSSKYAKVDAFGCVFSEASEAVVTLHGGNHNFSQCTIANYYLFTVISQPLLSLYHLFSDDISSENNNPLMKAEFDNCIIYGLASDINEGNLDNSDVFIRYTLMKSEGSDDDHFINCIWGEDPLFLTNRSDYYFNYHLQEDSPAIGKGDPAFTNPLTLFDMDGINRLANGNPALGAFAQ